METEKKEFLEKISKLENLLKEAKTNASNMASNDTAGNLLKEAKTNALTWPVLTPQVIYWKKPRLLKWPVMTLQVYRGHHSIIIDNQKWIHVSFIDSWFKDKELGPWTP